MICYLCDGTGMLNNIVDGPTFKCRKEYCIKKYRFFKRLYRELMYLQNRQIEKDLFYQYLKYRDIEGKIEDCSYIKFMKFLKETLDISGSDMISSMIKEVSDKEDNIDYINKILYK